MSVRLIRIAALYLVLGVTLGIVMGITHQFSLAPVHAHVNLLGWVTLGIIGVVYHLHPAAAETRLAHVHFWIHTTALPVFMIGLGFTLTGHEAFMPVTIAGATAVFAGIVVFAVNIWRTVRPVRQDATLRTPALRAAV
jgi:cbb3-type cytochrome oxidase subunit 1